jgi:transposase-like protein
MLKCKTCGSYFSEKRNTALYNCKLQEDKAFEILYQLSNGYSIRKINRLTGVSRDAISRLAHIERQYANSLCDELVRYLKVR